MPERSQIMEAANLHDCNTNSAAMLRVYKVMVLQMDIHVLHFTSANEELVNRRESLEMKYSN